MLTFKVFRTDPFSSSCVGISAKEAFTVRLDLRSVDSSQPYTI